MSHPADTGNAADDLDPRKRNAAMVLGPAGRLSGPSRAMLEHLRVPPELEFSELADFGVLLLESTALTVLQAADLWEACRDPALARGWSCCVVTRSLSASRVSRSVIAADLVKLGEDRAEAFFARKEQDWTGVDDEENLLAQRRETLTELTPAELPSFSVVAPNLARDDGNERRLVLLRGGLQIAPVLYRFGDFNACPLPYEHGLVLRAWHQRFGVELAFMGDDTLELFLPQPIADLDEIKVAAEQQFLYCEESESADEDLENVMSRIWDYWWD